MVVGWEHKEKNYKKCELLGCFKALTELRIKSSYNEALNRRKKYVIHQKKVSNVYNMKGDIAPRHHYCQNWQNILEVWERKKGWK